MTKGMQTMQSIKKLAFIASAAAVMGWTATAQAAPMLPKPFMCYSSASNELAFQQSIGFHMYFNPWRASTPTWGAHNIGFVTTVQGKQFNTPLPTPWRLARENKNTGGWTNPNNPYTGYLSEIPEPTGIAAIGATALLLGRRKREA